MKRNHLFLVSLFLCMGIRLLAQNPLTIIAPKYIKNSVAINLPNGPGTNDYHGAKAEFVSNAFPDAQGNLKFFIIDQFVYDSEGYLLEDLSPGAQVGNIQGRSELAVFKDPGNCERFYIFSSGQASGGSDEYRRYVLDFTQISNENSTRLGYLSVATTFISPGGGDGNAHWAVTKPRADGSHFVFVSKSMELKIYKVDNTGFSNVTTLPLNFNSEEIDYMRGEMEVFEFPDGNQVKYKVAFPYFRNGTVGEAYPSYHVVGTFNLDASGTLISSNQFLYPIIIANNDKSPFINGLEFDPTGRYLFITHDANTTAGYNTGIDYIDFNNSSPAITPLNVTGNLDFQNSQIEYLNLNSTPGLYMANATSFGRIIPNSNPASITVQTNVFGTGVAANYMYKDQLPNYPEYMNYKQFLLPDQIDGYNYRDFYVEPNDITCCNLNTNFDKTSFTASTNATWTSGSNPLAANGNTTNTVTIRDELRIPCGKVITIQNMILKFAPDAKLIIEEGNGTLDGGKLVLDNTTLTVDQRCSDNMLWQGVEVWGVGTVTQGTLYGSSQQGRLFVQNNSLIEHAKRGVLLTTIDPNTGVYSSTKSGGILIANGSTFRNNQRDVIARNYVSPTGANNLSTLVDCSFLITAQLKGGVGPTNRVEFYNMKGMTISGCTFSITEPTLYRSSYGVFSRNTTFNANARCTSGTVPCSSYDPNIFENFSYGIYVTNVSSTDAFSADRNTFINNNIGIRASSAGASIVTRNSFKLFENTTTQTSGLYLTGSTGYTVQENTFGIVNTTPLASAKTYGIVVLGSGIDANLIYKNTFKNLYVGGQSEGINASTVLGDASGLVWKCNTFQNPIAGYDLTVMNGRIGYNQGLTDPSNATLALQKAANNQFSLTGESVSLAHDFFLSNAQTINYVYTTSTTTVPDSYTTSLMTIQQSMAGSPLAPVQYTSAGCPSLLGGGKIQIRLNNDQLAADVDASEKMMLTNPSPELASKIQQLKNSIQQNVIQQVTDVLLNPSEDATLDEAIAILSGRSEKVNQQLLLDLLIKKGDVKAARELVADMSGTESADLLNRIRVNMTEVADAAVYLFANPSIVQTLKMIEADENDPVSAERAKNILSEITGLEKGYSFLVATPEVSPVLSETDQLAVASLTGNELMVYPNPTETNLIIENNGINGKLQIIDVTGKVVMNQLTGDQRTILDLSTLKAGVYIMIVFDESSAKQFTTRVVKR